MRGWRWWTELARLAGVAYFLGLAGLMVVTMLELVLGIPFGRATILANSVLLVVLGVLVGRRRGFAAPGLRPPGWRFPRISLVAAAFAAGIVVYFEALVRAERLAGVAREWDSWANWLPKSRSLYLSGHLDLDFMALVPQLPSYPPGPTIIQASAFHAMGSADAATLHLQYWFLAVGFVAAVVGFLSGRVRHAILLPALLALLVAPSLLDWITTVYADIPLGYFVALAGLLLILWIEEREPWHLAAATLLLSGAMLMKREGMLFAACVLLAGLVASFADRRQLWRRLFLAGLVAFALVLPWRIWIAAHDLPAAGYDTGYVGVVSDVDRLWSALDISVRTLFHRDLWSFVPVVAVAAILLALLAGAWRLSSYAVTLFVAGAAAVTWVLWVNHGLALVHEDWAIRRLMGTTVLALAVLTPLLLQRAWSASGPLRLSGGWSGLADLLFRPSLVAWLVVLVGLLSHPGSMVLGYSGSGLPGGWPSFPGASGCVVAPAADGNVRVVVGYADTYPEAMAMRERARAAGLVDTEASQDGCGRVRVFVDDVSSATASRTLVARAQAAGLSPELEPDPDD